VNSSIKHLYFCRYANGDIYEGYFREGQRHGHGVLKQGSLTNSKLASIYIGEWLNDKKYGYGVIDDILKGLYNFLPHSRMFTI
jgi:amyotrophic lateral sclerosis 2 protein